MDDLHALIALHEARMAELNYPDAIRRELRGARTKFFASALRRERKLAGR